MQVEVYSYLTSSQTSYGSRRSTSQPKFTIDTKAFVRLQEKKQIHNWHETSLVFTGCYTLHTQLQVRCGQLSSKFLHKYAIKDIVSGGR